MKVMRLEEAVRRHVEPGMHLHFPSTPSRSNVAIREVARVFRGRDPRFVLSCSGFHSTAHLLALMDLGRKYIACYFGDNYPIPRPNPIYDRLDQRPDVELQFWSLLSYVSSFRAGALGHRWAVVNSLLGTSMAEDLTRAGMFATTPDPSGNGPPMGLVAAMRPDVTFVHAPVADPEGNVVVAPPFAESFWSALGARRGVIVTVEKVVEPDFCARFKDAGPLPPHRVLAVCEEPMGAHPQPLNVPDRLGVPGYGDDFDHYVKWREMTLDEGAFGDFVTRVLEAADPTAAYREYIGGPRPPRPPRVEPPSDPTAVPPESRWVKENAAMLVVGARAVCERVRAGGYQLILAGLGRSFFVARLAKLWLSREGIDVRVVVETGLFDLACGEEGDPFILSHRNVENAARLSDAEHVLGALTCGADSRCLGVLSSGQVDALGRLNSTRLRGKLMVGSGGANDIASSAAEVVVITRCQPGRMVPEVDYVTSPGWRVRCVATDLCALTRESADDTRWTIAHLYPGHGGAPVEHALERVRQGCPWHLDVPEGLTYAPPASSAEMLDIHRLDPEGVLWTREAETGAKP